MLEFKSISTYYDIYFMHNQNSHTNMYKIIGSIFNSKILRSVEKIPF